MKRPIVVILSVVTALILIVALMIAYIAHQVSSSEIQERILTEFYQVFPRGNISIEKVEVKYGTTINVHVLNLVSDVTLPKSGGTYPLFRCKDIIIKIPVKSFFSEGGRPDVQFESSEVSFLRREKTPYL